MKLTDLFSHRSSTYHRDDRRHSINDLLFSALVAYAWIGLSSNFLSFWHSSGPLIISSRTWKLAALAAAGLWFISPLVLRRSPGNSRPRLSAGPFIIAAGLLIFTDFPERISGFHISRRFFFVSAAVSVIVIFLIRRNLSAASRLRQLLVPIFWGIQIALTVLFLKTADGRVIWSDDHPSFLYRLILLRDHFPFLPFYNTQWNTSYLAREVYPTGALSLYFLSYPFVHWLGDIADVAQAHVYNFIIPHLMIVLLPWSGYWAARKLECSRLEGLICGLLFLGPTMSLFEFGLKFGTLPFVISAGLLPLSLIILCSVAFDADLPPLSIRLVGVVVLFLCLCWHLMVLAFLPFCLFLLCSYRDLFRSRRVRPLLIIAALVLLLCGPSLFSLARDYPLLDLFKRHSLPGSSTEMSTVQAVKKSQNTRGEDQQQAQPPHSRFGLLAELRRAYSQLSAKVNPLLLVLILPAFAAFPRGPKRQILIATMLWLTAVALLGQYIKPQLELHRFFLAACFLSCLPVSRFIGRHIHGNILRLDDQPSAADCRTMQAAGALAILLGILLTLPVTLARIYTDNSHERFRFAPAELSSFVQAIKEHAGSGRLFFTGFILHDLGSTDYRTQDGGHIAPLAAFTGVPMFASQFYHVYWSTVDPIPQVYRDRDEAGIEEFLDLVNATAVVTFRREWTRYCAKRARYHEVWHEGRFHIFTRSSENKGYLLSGNGSAQSLPDKILVKPESEELVLKFRYYPRLRTDHPDDVELFPVPAYQEDLGGGKEQQIDFIGMRLKPGVRLQSVEIGYPE
jgi:hypothetical protein